MLFRAAFRRSLGVGVLASFFAGCLQPGDYSLAAPGTDASVVDASTTLPDVTADTCSLQGAGRLRVSVSLAPALASRTADVWLAVYCNDGTAPVRLVRWDGSATQSLEGFGPGTYRVLGTSFLSQGAWSTSATLGGIATAAVSLTLTGDSAVLALASSAPGTTRPDAGATDASIGDGDAAGTTPEWNARVQLRDVTGGPGLGAMQVFARPVSPDTLELSVTVQNLCAPTTCPPLSLLGVEARTLEGSMPTGVSAATFEMPTVNYGEVRRAGTLRLHGTMPDTQHTLMVALYAPVQPGSRNAARMTP